jgi:hypothetical protein
MQSGRKSIPFALPAQLMTPDLAPSFVRQNEALIVR